jgi:RNA polymerase sigma-70 factor (ECF subfamily)
MERYASGSQDAFEELFHRFEPRAYTFFLRRTRSPERARDLYQELFLRIHRGRRTYDPARPFKPWFFQIAHRVWIDDREREHAFHERALDGHEPHAEECTGEDRIASRDRLLEVLGSLSPTERHVLVASRLDGIGYRELARDLGKSIEAVKKLASRALQRLGAAPHGRLGSGRVRPSPAPRLR